MIRNTKNRLFYLSWLTLFGMSAMGVLIIHYIEKKGVTEVLTSGKPYYLQMLTGLFYGSLSALLGVLLINNRRFKNIRGHFEDLMGEINPSIVNIVFYSLCAGVGEEILFRAGVQNVTGVWPAAVLFVILHGYIMPSNLNLTIYGLFLIVICAGFGYLFKFFGLYSAVIAHVIYDISMFSILKYSYRRAMDKAMPA